MSGKAYASYLTTRTPLKFSSQQSKVMRSESSRTAASWRIGSETDSEARSSRMFPYVTEMLASLSGAPRTPGARAVT